MRILRVRLRNYRGVQEVAVSFARDGVTVVQGPNEAGKSSLVEAIDVLFDEQDSTTKKSVLAIQPVGRDVPTEIEMEVEVGPYAFVYRKQFHREKLTELSITRPSPEQWKGREAHERVQQLLAQHMDLGLWKAIRIAQGNGELLPELETQTTLSEALDQVAGGARAGEREESLFERARKEFELYFTPKTGQPVGVYRDSVAKLRDAQNECASAAEALRGLEADVRRSADLAADHKRLERSLVDARAALSACEQKANALDAKREQVESLEAKLSPIALETAAAKKTVEDSERVVADAEAAGVAFAQAQAARDENEPLAQAISTEVKEAELAYSHAKDAVERAIALERIRRNDETFRNSEIELARNRERYARVVDATEKGTLAKRELDENLVTDEMLERVRKAELALLAAQEVLRTASPRIRLLARDAVTLELAGRSFSLASGEKLDEPVLAELELEVVGKLQVIVSPGASAEELSARLARAEAEHSAVLSEARVASLEEAVGKNEKRHEAERAIADLKRVVRDDLRDWTRDQLGRSITNLERVTTTHLETRPKEPPMAAELREARRLHEEAEAALVGARERVEATERQRDVARIHSEEFGRRQREVDTQWRMASERKARAMAALAELEKGASLAELRRKRDALISQELVLRDELRQAAATLKHDEPELVATRLVEAREVVTRLLDEERVCSLERARIQAVLQTKNEHGYGEALALAESKLHHIQDEHARMTRHAEAARLLYQTLSRARDNARRRYVAPLQERINALGRMVFDPSFHVELNDELRVVSRTLLGQTVPFDSLSQGASEQLSLLVRLACGMMVAKTGGVPLIFDDALGATDKGRLEEMAAALRHAAKECQIIVLTCMPERFTHVLGARVTLERQRALTPASTP